MSDRGRQRGEIRRAKVVLDNLTGPLSITKGGTGAITSSAARSSLGLGTAATQAYTELTFTPTLMFGGASVDMTYDAQVGRAIKTGKCVAFQINIDLSAKGTSTGNVTVGLGTLGSSYPLVTATGYAAVFFVHARQVTLNTAGGFYSVAAQSASGGSTISLYEQGTSVGITPLTDADFANNSVITISGVYEAAT